MILAGKCGSHRHSTTSFRENVIVAKTSYQMSGILRFSDRERASPPSKKISELAFVVKKKKQQQQQQQKNNEVFRGVYF